MILTQPDRDRLTTLLKTSRTVTASGSSRSDLFESLSSAEIVEPWLVPDNIVTMNSVVNLIDLANGEIATYALVYPHDANVDRLKISVLAPLGAALIGRAEGDVVAFSGPAGTRRFFIQKVIFQPEQRFRETQTGEGRPA
jgi:regulator of nucleoside diphosphate kinase